MSLILKHDTTQTLATKLKFGQVLLVLGHFYKVSEVPVTNPPRIKGGEPIESPGSANLLRGLTGATQQRITLHTASNYQVVHPDDAQGLAPTRNNTIVGQQASGQHAQLTEEQLAEEAIAKAKAMQQQVASNLKAGDPVLDATGQPVLGDDGQPLVLTEEALGALANPENKEGLTVGDVGVLAGLQHLLGK